MQSVHDSRCRRRGQSIAFPNVTDGGRRAVRRKASGLDVRRANADPMIVPADPMIVRAGPAVAGGRANRRVNRVWVEFAGVRG